MLGKWNKIYPYWQKNYCALVRSDTSSTPNLCYIHFGWLRQVPSVAGACVVYFCWDHSFPSYNTEKQNQSEKADPNRSRLSLYNSAYTSSSADLTISI